VLGQDPDTGLEVTLRSGRFGPYVQLGEQTNGEKPKRTPLPKGVSPDDVDLERAIALLGLPREVGAHPETGEPIVAGLGRYGPYVQHGKTYASLEPRDDVLNIGLNRAVTLIAEKQSKGGRGRRFGADPGRALGEHPVKGGAILAKHGRYGPYVSHNGVNATLPPDKTPETVKLEDAVALIDAKAGVAGSSPMRRSRKAGAQKARALSKSRSRGSTPAAPSAKSEKPMRRRKAAD
jgi:DNA topoisomerase-1